ncbi:hypothetical protein [Mycolicibacterium psychrotolerans]|uniref:Secreted protein n=1 Tax=Mycolicibacterium psychrotolerans TaxID=216929 RepID=A0A7I7MEM8_9MYCO|nr:hypothetical protein [Mycolicibacterium psychrotolerans]BBX70655.1 hypothetical protein MPSYJ_41160 [Mycolicibacterium psychrotolerans]
MIGSQRADRPRGGRMTIARSRGAASGLLLVLLGIWGALIPFIGPNFDFAFTPDQPWIWTTGRGWLEVLPGVVTVIGGLLLMTSRNRATAMLGGWLTVAAGAWFVIGRALAGPLGLGDAGSPVASEETKRVWLDLTYFYGLGALIIFLGALALGRVSVRSVRDVEYVGRAAAVDTPAHTGPVPVTHTAPATATTPVGGTPTEVIDPQQQRAPRRRGLRNMFRGRRDRTLTHH